MNVKNKNNLHFLYCKHFDIKCMNGDLTFHLCSASLELHSADILVSKAKNTETYYISSFENSDKFVYVKSGFPILPERAVIAGCLCRIWYASRRNQCDRCHKHHKSMGVDQCEAYSHNHPDVRVFANGHSATFHTAR